MANMERLANDGLAPNNQVTPAVIQATLHAHPTQVVVCACMRVNMCMVHRVQHVTCASWHAMAASGIC